MDDSSLAGVDDVLEAELLFVHPPRENIRTMDEGLSDLAFEKEDMQAKLNEKVRRNNDLTIEIQGSVIITCLLYTSPSPRDRSLSRMPSSA